MTFVLLMAGREIRSSWRRLLFFFVCVAIGVGAIVALRSMIQNIRNGLTREARALIAGDVVIGTNRAWTPQLRAEIDRRLADAPIVVSEGTAVERSPRPVWRFVVRQDEAKSPQPPRG